jgi:hypothetical protein
MIVLSEDRESLTPSASARENRIATETAKLLGFRVYYIPEDFSRCENAENALAHIPVQDKEQWGIWVGYIPTPERYEAIYTAALRRRIRLLNTPEQHLTAQEFDRAYSQLQGLTPESLVLTSPQQCTQAVQTLELPVFVRGAVQSRKTRGWKACVADTLEELQHLTKQMLLLEGRSRGRVIVRKLVHLRHCQSSPEGFPFGREYRIFLYGQRVLAWGYYWEGDDPLKPLASEEETAVLELAREAAKRLAVPYVTIDIGQLQEGQWIVIEAGDAQFSGISQIPPLKLWNALREIDASHQA